MSSQYTPSLIIIEGPDLAGKSTYIDSFNDAYYIKHHFGSMPDIKTPEKYFDEVASQLGGISILAAEDRKDVIIDRSWISDAAYKDIRGDGGRVHEEHNLQFVGLALSLFRKVATVILLPTFSVLQERYNIRGDELITPATLMPAYTHYEKIYIDGGKKRDVDLSSFMALTYGIPSNVSSCSCIVAAEPPNVSEIEAFIKIETFIKLK